MDTDFPTIADAASEAVAAAFGIVQQPTPTPAPLKDIALASFVPIEAHITALAQRFANVAFDLSTPKGLAAGRAARHELREDGRYAVQRLQKRLKDEANDLKKVLDAEGERLIAIIKPVEDAVHAQIEAEEARREAVRVEAARIEAARVGRCQEFIAVIRSYLARCNEPGMTAERISTGMEVLCETEISAQTIDEDFIAPAEAARRETVAAMRLVLDAAIVRENEAARIEAARIENERIAAEQAERQRALDRQAAELKRQADELAAQRAESERLERQAEERRAAQASAEAVERGRQMAAAGEARMRDVAMVSAAAAVDAFVAGKQEPQNSQRQESAGAAPLADKTTDAPAVAAQAEGEGASAPSPGSAPIPDDGSVAVAMTLRFNHGDEVVRTRIPADAFPATAPKVATPEGDRGPALVERLLAEAALCRNDGANDIAALLEESAAAHIEGAALIEQLEAAMVDYLGAPISLIREHLNARAVMAP